MYRILPFIILLSSCAAIKVTETEDTCVLSGTIFDFERNASPQWEGKYDFKYEGNNCIVYVSK